MVHAFREHEPTPHVARHSQKQHGVITLDQARTAGLSQRQVDGMVLRGDWRRPYRAVFIDNSAPITPMQSVIAASFGACGLASHRFCLWMGDLRPLAAPDALEFSVPYCRNVRLPAVKIYRVRETPPA